MNLGQKRRLSMRTQGIWFYGLSGSGKSYAACLLAKKIQRSFLLDGDAVRNRISTDLDYSKADREIQIKRIWGISMLTIDNGYFPIASSVTMSEEILELCNNNFINVIEIVRPKSQLYQVRDLYEHAKNVVGKDIMQAQLSTDKLFNDGSKHFDLKVLQIAQQI